MKVQEQREGVEILENDTEKERYEEQHSDLVERLKDRVLGGGYIEKSQAMTLADENLETLCQAADQIRKRFCGNHFDICTIINGKSGSCTEDCRYCAQSSHYGAASEQYPLLGAAALVKGACQNHERGILRYSVVTSGRTLSEEEVSEMCESYRRIGEACGISLCASHGLLTFEELASLRESGVERYHNNLETSRSRFPAICTTHTYEDKLETIQNAQKAGLEVCSGGIFGLGETMEDRIDMAYELKALGVHSVPMNILNPIEGTPLEDAAVLTVDEIRRIAAVYRFILPDAALRLAGGRGLLEDKGRSVFRSGANAAISGDMLTTSGICIQEDMIMIEELGFQVHVIGERRALTIKEGEERE